MVRKGQVLKYTLLPEIFPRLKDLFAGGFAHVAYLIAQIFGNLGLLPLNHAYLNPQNFGRFSIRKVMAEAANNLDYSKKNIDQVLIYYSVLTGLVLLTLQIILVILTILIPFVDAAPVTTGTASTAALPSWQAWFGNISPDYDIAFMVLDKVFGVEGVFHSCISQSTVCEDYHGNPIENTTGSYPYPIHKALHGLFSFYSYGIFFVATIIILYFVVTLIGETAATGKPFGSRMNKTWTVPRLIVFFALLMPLNMGNQNAGLNGAQLITMYAAKYGSNFATNAWERFNVVLTTSYLGDVQNLIAQPNYPETGDFLQYMYTVKTCQFAESSAYPHEVEAYVIRNNFSVTSEATINALTKNWNISPEIITALKSDNAIKLIDISYPEAFAFANYGDIQIVFGVRDEKKYADKAGYVNPICGAIDISVTDGNTDFDGETAHYYIKNGYFITIQYLWWEDVIAKVAKCQLTKNASWLTYDGCTDEPNEDFVNEFLEIIESTIHSSYEVATEVAIEEGEWDVDEALLAKGWAGGALWYQRIAEMNGAVTSAIFNFPRPKNYPYVMEFVASERRKYDPDPNPAKRFDPHFKAGIQPNYPRSKDDGIANALNIAYSDLSKISTFPTSETRAQSNAFIDTVNVIFGTSGILDMRNNTDVHPLAQLSSLGRGIIEATVRNTLIAFTGAVAGGLGSRMEPFLGQLGNSVSGVMKAVIMASLALGFTLYYVVPMMPFVYFLFAFSEWVKAIFEAMVAMPLWALSHIHIDGDGLPGKNAANGYFLLFEIFLRPILILFGLLASITIFAAMVQVLNDIFDLVVNNAGGFDAKQLAEKTETDLTSIETYRGPIDQFFFSVLYVVVCYMIGLSCFKLIDLIPKQLMRWMGFGVETMQEMAGDPAGKLTSTSFSGTQKLGFMLQRLSGDRGVNMAELA